VRRKNTACSFNLFFNFLSFFSFNFFSQLVCWISPFRLRVPSMLFLILTACSLTPITRQLVRQLLLSRARIRTASNWNSLIHPLADRLTQAKLDGLSQVPKLSLCITGIQWHRQEFSLGVSDKKCAENMLN
jgi:hypothetical protein